MSIDMKNAAEYSISQFMVEKIFKHRLNPEFKNYELFCRWKGLSRHYNSWVCLRSIYSRAPNMVIAYLRSLTDKDEYELLAKYCLAKAPYPQAPPQAKA